MNRRWLSVVFLFGTAMAFGSRLSFQEHAAVQESLRHLPPSIRLYELDRPGLMPRTAASVSAESTGLKLVGKWGAGPSVKVTGRDSLVFLSRGSQVAVINYADTANPRILSYIEVNGLVSRSVLVGNRLYVGSTGSDPRYIDVFDVTNPANPQKLGQLQTRLLDVDVVDTLVYTVAKDSLRVFNFADPANPHQIGVCRDSGYNLSVSNGYAYIGDRWGLYVLDVTDPSNPHRIASWGSDVISVKARGNICCATLGNPNQPTYLKFYVLDVRQPASITPLGSLDSCGGYDIFLDDSLAFVSGYYTGGHEFRVLSIADSVHPYGIGGCVTPGDNFGVWCHLPSATAFVADRQRGLATIDVSDLGNPTYKRMSLAAAWSEDVTIQGNYAYVGNQGFGLKVLDISNPSLPFEVGSLDTGYGMSTYSVAVQDSFAYMVWSPNRPWLRSIDVTDPTAPTKAGGVGTFDFARDMVVRDTFLYLAEPYRFQVVNVARPREPLLVGSCVLGGDVWDLDVEDTIAYVTSNALTMVNIARPDSPRVVATWNTMVAIDVEDTIAYTIGSGAVWSLSVARPSQPYVLDTVGIPDWKSDIVVSDSLLFAGGQTLYVIDKRDPRNLRILGRWTPPEEFRRLLWSPPYVYAACYDAGVCILETLATGIAEQHFADLGGHVAQAFPSVTRGPLAVDFGCPVDGIYVRNATGQRIAGPFGKGGDANVRRLEIDLSGYPDGVYFVESATTSTTRSAKIIKTGRR